MESASDSDESLASLSDHETEENDQQDYYGVFTAYDPEIEPQATAEEYDVYERERAREEEMEEMLDRRFSGAPNVD